MPKRFRRKLFYSLILIFLILGVGVIFYAQGWRLDFSSFKLEKVGAIYIRSFPDDAKIELNGKPTGAKQGLLDSGRFIGNLLPKNYKLSIAAAGYQNWEENITVKPALVTEIKKAVLIPQNSQLIEDNVKNFWLAGQKITILNNNNRLLFDGKSIAGNKVAAQSDDSLKILTENNKSEYFWNDFSDLQSGSDSNINLNLEKSGLKINASQKITIDSSGSGLIIYSSHTLWTFDLKNSELNRLYKTTSTISALADSPDLIVWSIFEPQKNSSSFIVYDKNSLTTSTISQTVGGKTAKLKIIPGHKLAFIQSDGGFYIYGRTNGTISKIASDVKDFVFTDDGLLTACLENDALEVFSFDGSGDYWRFRPPDITEAKTLIWYRDQAHLFIQYPENFYFLDLNDKSLNNFRDIAPASLGYYDSQNDKLYLLKDGALREMEFPGLK